MGVHPKQLKERMKEREKKAIRVRLARDRLEYNEVVQANRKAVRPK
jgi:hypothetical protein